MGISTACGLMFVDMQGYTISKGSNINEEKNQICLPNRKYIINQRCVRTSMVPKCKILVTVISHIISTFKDKYDCQKRIFK